MPVILCWGGLILDRAAEMHYGKTRHFKVTWFHLTDGAHDSLLMFTVYKGNTSPDGELLEDGAGGIRSGLFFWF